jgi:hypothetical protein
MLLLLNVRLKLGLAIRQPTPDKLSKPRHVAPRPRYKKSVTLKLRLRRLARKPNNRVSGVQQSSSTMTQPMKP